MSDLPPRLAQVSALVVQGLTNKAIARQLGLTPRTAALYVAQAAHRLPGPGPARVRIVRWFFTASERKAA